MDDKELIRLYQARDERAITESEQKYGSFLRRIALNLLGSPEDAEECVNDALLAAWNRIPPHEPDSLKAFLSKLIRDIAISRFRESHAAKRGNGTLTEVLDDLAETIPSSFSVDEEVEANALSALIEGWLRAQKRDERVLFIRRYYYGESVKSLAAACGCSQQKMAQIMLRLRRSLKKAIEDWSRS